MEDAHFAQTNLGEDFADWSYFAVFDGHAGYKVSEHCAKHLLEAIIHTEEFRGSDVIKAIHSGFLKLDHKMRDIPELASGADKSGTTAVCAFISNENVYIANCGDSRAVLCRNGVPVFSTQDHKPILPTEKKRIVNAGGSVMVQRVNGSLAVSRALGDYDYKNVSELGQCEQLVSPEPEIFCQERDGQDYFLVLACDGVWDVMSNEAVCSFISNRLRLTDDLELICNQVIDTCLHKVRLHHPLNKLYFGPSLTFICFISFQGSRDNMSIILILFPGAPQKSPEAIEAEEELERNIRKTIKGYYKKYFCRRLRTNI
jgi:protein phosphatase 1B